MPIYWRTQNRHLWCGRTSGDSWKSLEWEQRLPVPRALRLSVCHDTLSHLIQNPDIGYVDVQLHYWLFWCIYFLLHFNIYMWQIMQLYVTFVWTCSVSMWYFLSAVGEILQTTATSQHCGLHHALTWWALVWVVVCPELLVWVVVVGPGLLVWVVVCPELLVWVVVGAGSWCGWWLALYRVENH